MELQSPYLEAIQAIPGTTPGQKFKQLNSIARRIAEGCKAGGDSTSIAAEVPEALLPLVRVEIANLLNQPKGIVEALISEDSFVVYRALRINWFFRGSDKVATSVGYYDSRILPYASLNTRNKLIKRLAINLRTSGETAIAEDFYGYLAGKYGRASAEALFVACSEDFIWKTITKHKIILSGRAVKNLFLPYPELVIRYLRRSKTDENHLHEDGHKVDLSDYADFLPRLIKKHQNAFVELLETASYGMGIQLSNKATETFLKNNVDALLNKPSLYTSIMPLKVITAKLTKPQFRVMFEKLFPAKSKNFSYYNIAGYLKYYPEQEIVSLIVDSYRSVYNANLFDNHDAITPELLCILPSKERIRQARIKLEKEPDWRANRYSIVKVWRCYLPVDETIPAIKHDISKCSADNDRNILMEQMLYTCKVNNDKDAIVEILRYFTTRHKNEQIHWIFDILRKLVNYFDLYTFGKEHWAILNDFIKFLDVKDKCVNNGDIVRSILAPSIYYNLVHDLPIDDKIYMLINVNLESWNPSWSILEKYPEYDRRCFEAILSMIPEKFPPTAAIWYTAKITDLVRSMYAFNARIAKGNNKLEKLLVKNYPWLCDLIKKLIEKLTTDKDDWRIKCLISTVNENEPEFFKDYPLPVDEEEALDMKTFAALGRLRDDPQNILDHWEAYLKKAKCSASDRYVQRFVKVTRWHQSIPIKFAERCLKDVAERTDDCYNSILILAVLLEGSALARIIEPLLPTDSKIETTNENSKKDYALVRAIPQAMNIANPPVPLSFVLSFCDGEYLNLGLVSLANVCRRTSLAKIKPFTKTLIDRRVSVRKHGIRLFCLVSSIDDIGVFLMELWKTETHRSIRAVIFTKIRDLFICERSPYTLLFMKKCIDNLKNDDDDIVSSAMDMNGIPDEYIANYIKTLFGMLEKLKANGFDAKIIVDYTRSLINGIDDARMTFLPEDFARDLLRKYFGNYLFEWEINRAAMIYVLHHYIRPEKPDLESRLSFLCSLYEDILKRQWDIPDPKAPKFHPINHLLHDFVSNLTTRWKPSANTVKIMKAILETYLAVLKPEQDYVSYASLTLSVALNEIVEPKGMAMKINETLPRLVEALSPEMVGELTHPIKELIEHRIDKSERTDEMYTLIETLCQTGNVHSCIIAAHLLFHGENSTFDDRHNKIVESLRQMKHPAVSSLANHHRNTTTDHD